MHRGRSCQALDPRDWQATAHEAQESQQPYRSHLQHLNFGSTLTFLSITDGGRIHSNLDFCALVLIH
jgi:hypothetical protein